MGSRSSCVRCARCSESWASDDLAAPCRSVRAVMRYARNRSFPELDGAQSLNIYDVIAKWDLDTPSLNFKRFSRGAIALMAHEVQQCYAKPPAPALGRFHQSLPAAVKIVEGASPVEDLSLPLLFSKQFLLPDPIDSALSMKANSTWNRLPESGNPHFSSGPKI